MAFGSLITSVSANLDQLSRDLDAAREKFRQFYADIDKMGARVSVGGAGRGGGGGGGGASRTRGIDVSGYTTEMDAVRDPRTGRNFLRTTHAPTYVDRDPAENDVRGFRAKQTKAIAENAKVAADARKKEDADNLRRYQAREADTKTVANFEKQARKDKEDEDRKEYARLVAQENREKSERQFRGKQTTAEAENQKKTDAENLRRYQARLADDKTVANFEAAARKEEADALKKAEADKRAAGQTARQANAERLNDLRQRQKFEDGLAAQSAKDEREARASQRKTDADNRKAAQAAREAGRERTAELKRSAEAAARLNQHFGKMKDALGNIANAAKGVAGFLGAGAFAGIGAAVAEAFNYNRQLQLTKLSLATDLQLTTQIVNQHGKRVSQQQELNVNLAEASIILKQIRKEAESTTLTEKELQAVSRIGLAGGLRGGAAKDPSQAIHLVAQLGNLAKILQPNLGPEALVASVRSVTGASPAVRRTALGQVLDLDPKQLRAWKDQGTLVQHVLDILRRADPIIQQANASFDHLWSTLISKGQRFLQLSLEKVFEKITGRVFDLNKAFSDEAVGKWAKQFSDDLVRAYDAVQNFGKSDGFKAIQSFFKFLVEHATEILNVFIAVKSVQALKTGQSILQDVSTLAGGLAKRGAGGAAAGAEEAGVVGAGAVAAGGLSGFLGSVGGLAGFLAAAVPVVIAGLVGYGIGNLLSATVGPLVEAVGHYFGGREGPTAELNRSIAGGEAAVRRRSPRQRQLAALRGQELQDRQAFINAQSPDDVRATANQFRGTRAHIARLEHEGAQEEKTNKDHLRRIALDSSESADEAARKKRQKALELQAWLNRLLSKGTEDEAQQLKMRYKADAESVYAKLGVTKQANQVVAQLFQQLQAKLADAREVSANKERKLLADLRDDKLAKLEAEYHDNLKTISDSDRSEAEKSRDRLEARKKFERESFEQKKEWADKARDLARQETDDELELQRTKQRLRKETEDLNRKFAKEAKDLAREEADAARDLGRAQIDRRLSQGRLFGTPASRTPASFVSGRPEDPVNVAEMVRAIREGRPIPRRQDVFTAGVNTPGVASFVDEHESIRTAAQQLFGGNVGGLLQQGFQRQGFAPDLAQAQSQAQIRKLVDAAQSPGGTQDVLQQLQQGGVGSISPEFRQQLEGIEARSTRLQGREEDAQRETEQEQIRREKEDAGRPASDAQRRIKDLADQEAQARKDYQEGIKRIQDDYKKQVVDITGKFVSLGTEVQKLTREMAASNQHIPMDLRGLARTTPGQARTHVASALAPVYHITFGPGSLSVKGLTLAEIKTALHELLTREGRAAAPPRR